MEREHLAEMSTAEKLRHNAELIARQVGHDWRAELAAKMGCEISDVGVGPIGRVRDSEPLDVSNFRVLLRGPAVRRPARE